jgi:hypothetical protein
VRALLLALVLGGAAACSAAPVPAPAPKSEPQPLQRLVVYCDGHPAMWSEALQGETFVLFVPERCGSPKVEVE